MSQTFARPHANRALSGGKRLASFRRGWPTSVAGSLHRASFDRHVLNTGNKQERDIAVWPRQFSRCNRWRLGPSGGIVFVAC
jgi:hypothetical protein